MSLYHVYRSTDTRPGFKRVWFGEAENASEAVRIAAGALVLGPVLARDRRGLFARLASDGEPDKLTRPNHRA